MKSSAKAICLFFLTAVMAGCVMMRPAARIDKRGTAASLPVYSGAKAKITVADFELKAPNVSQEIGAALREMSLSVLLNSKRFKIQERPVSDTVKTGPAPQGADLIINVAVTEFQPQTSGGSAGTGGGGGVNNGALGGLLGSDSNKAHITMDVRIIDAASSSIIATGRAQGQAADISGAIMSGSSTSWALTGKLFAYANTPMEKAIRICIIEAARYIATSIPESYYKY